MSVRIINVAGFGNTGCTSQADFLSDYEGVRGILADPHRNKKVIVAPYQEFGLLKCEYTLGGLIIWKLKGAKKVASVEVLRASLRGDVSYFKGALEKSEEAHMKKRALLREQYGAMYDKIVDASLECLPKKYEKLNPKKLLPYVRRSLEVWLDGVISVAVNENENGVNSESIDTLGLKNDPPGAYPLLSTIIPAGVTSAILRDPRDTNFDFNSGNNSFGHTEEAMKKHCLLYNLRLELCQKQIKKYDEINPECYFVHDFESFVSSESHRQTYLNRMLGNRVRERLRSSFVPELSVNNIGIYKSLPKSSIQYIEDACMKKYVSFRNFLKDRELLFNG